MSSTAWYVAVDDTTRGPAPTELVIKGIEHRKVPPEAMVCAAGSGRWMPLSSVPAFHTAVVRSYPPPPPHSTEARQWLDQGFHFPPPAPLPRFDDGIAMEWRPGPRTSRASVHSIPGDQRGDRPGAGRAVPHRLERAVRVLLPRRRGGHPPGRARAPGEPRGRHARDVRREESMWNLALCLAYGSNRSPRPRRGRSSRPWAIRAASSASSGCAARCGATGSCPRASPRTRAASPTSACGAAARPRSAPSSW